MRFPRQNITSRSALVRTSITHTYVHLERDGVPRRNYQYCIFAVVVAVGVVMRKKK